ncbi:5'-3' exonuclease, N-terminal resolvase, putative [Plasmodium knowlesi strain H]|uniref:5'-3' exonuclease, N-terminal resolvase, putative n=3 Tax=Plasmodium knowlesi TaxID=5850 RepID=A0A5K1UW67_PLAKH|nr:5'-3' exonuclease, putative [Plasmodium knowlesi strain H]OTN66717.1 putative 5'-3' exonuclease - N-terminal resolvase [Plasmodium knowlesi]CAA9986811.1 5'-3' exonuclease, putative [Plasmodium knowlesi strain H]SBO23659.1 5'-3' exonuclease, N-terminal resolvase, putative [Plasmodium knowlesi strain H]SBO25229.1 5'-3' exonuclease, N-terminal resolvase, putative [Plasmodium knowlesi strain H]VVS76285.1 5'-3' exonuclease, putative [Plasmodium knowlesi strain H]|eukprot:XP_002257996.1 5'-3' exonuclease, N-terminal resolvase,putative [Plasmodium knowlesi strain H]
MKERKMNGSLVAIILLAMKWCILWAIHGSGTSIDSRSVSRSADIKINFKQRKRISPHASPSEKKKQSSRTCAHRKELYIWRSATQHTKGAKGKRNIPSYRCIKLSAARKKTNGTETKKESNSSPNDMETFLIVDGSSILFKNFFGMPYLKNESEINLSTIYGFIQSLNKVYKLFCPSYVVIVFDSKTSNDEKKKIYAKYKIMRKKNPEELYEQLKLVNDFCDLIGIKTVSPTNVESDNYIAAIVDSISNTLKAGNISHYSSPNGGETTTQKEFRVIVVSSDKDLLQLLEYNDDAHNNMDISICQPNRKYRVVDASTFIQEHNLLPAQYSDYLIMAGDKTDGITGIPNIGDKTSKNLLKQFHTIDNILKNLHNLPQKLHAIFLNNFENINIFRKLIKLKCETHQSLVLSEYRQGSIKDFERFQNILDKYSLHKLIKKTVIVNYEGGKD